MLGLIGQEIMTRESSRRNREERNACEEWEMGNHRCEIEIHI